MNKFNFPRKCRFLLLLQLLLLVPVLNSLANNVSVSNVSITGQDVSAGTNNAANFSLIKFNIGWENSWRSSALNWDAVWVFVKYRVGAGAWNHAYLNNTGHTAATGSTITTGLLSPSATFNTSTNPGVGAFIYRSADGSGTVSYSNVQLRWNYGSQGVNDNAVLDVQVFAIEMVNIPTAQFAVGDGASNSNQFTITTINTSSATSAPTGTGSLGGQAGGYPTGQTSPANVTWPNGYNSFYCMKYEISQGIYRDFLNTLDFTQQSARTAQTITVAGNMALIVDRYPYSRAGIEVKAPGISPGTPAIFGCDVNDNDIYNESDDGEWIACNNISKSDVLAFLDWSALRPMTELEFEKSCRGTLAPVSGEYAWGTNSITSNSYLQTYNLVNLGAANEQVAAQNYSTTSGVGNTHYIPGSYAGPLRCGIFAANPLNSGRATSGGTYYGIMEMSANVGEIVVSLFTTNGRNFQGTHGDGSINVSGVHTNGDWSSAGLIDKGGNVLYGRHEVSFRYSYYQEARHPSYGGRGVRAAQ